MQEGIQRISFFLISIIIIVLAMIPLFASIQTGFDSTEGYYENFK